MLQILDDNAMNLQSMTASRFVGPFLDGVRKWEKSLSHISEVVEVGDVSDGFIVMIIVLLLSYVCVYSICS